MSFGNKEDWNVHGWRKAMSNHNQLATRKEQRTSSEPERINVFKTRNLRTRGKTNTVREDMCQQNWLLSFWVFQIMFNGRSKNYLKYLISTCIEYLRQLSYKEWNIIRQGNVSWLPWGGTVMASVDLHTFYYNYLFVRGGAWTCHDIYVGVRGQSSGSWFSLFIPGPKG